MKNKHHPAYCLHKASGQAVVRIDGQDHYLGKHGSPESWARYNQLIACWYANAQTLPPPAAGDTLTINDLLLAFWRWAETHYRTPDGNPGRELDNLRDALRPLRRAFGSSLARAFGPQALRAVREDMIQAGLCRTVVNSRINRIRRVFKWAASFELIPVSVHEALRTVAGLSRGRSKAREPEPVEPIPEEQVVPAIPFMPTPVQAMVQVQLLAGCRVGEVMVMRALDLTMTGPVWVYRPARHKNQHRGRERVIYLGPKAQDVIRPFLTADPAAYLFSPREYVDNLHRRRAQQRRTKRTPSEKARRRKTHPKRKPGACYSRRSYRLAIVRACQAAGVPPWSPLQLRHTAATRIRSQYGLEVAQAILGHTRVETTQIYAERDLARAAQVMQEVG